MRNLALAGVLRIRDNVDAFYALCAPAGNRAIWRRWDEARDVLRTFLMHDLPAEHILAHHTPNDADALRPRYLLEPPAHHLVATDKEWQTWQLVATDPPGGVADLDLTSLPRR
jgi:hypothetical protein